MAVENLITDHELAVWAGKTDEQVTNDPLAQDVMSRMSEYAYFLAGTASEDWTYTTAPFDVRLVVLKVCRRAYTNPDEIVQEGGVGPIGGDRVRDEAAQSLELTEEERATITKYNPLGDPQDDGLNGLWVQPTYISEPDATLDAVLYVGDDSQIGLAGSADPREWKIPLFNPGDPGDPNLYPEG